MKIYVMSRIYNNEIQKPKVSKDLKNLQNEMIAEYKEKLNKALEFNCNPSNGLIANYCFVDFNDNDDTRFEWQIDEIKC